MKIFSKHSLERLVQRNIDRLIILRVPDKEFLQNERVDSKGNLILHKLKDGKLLRIFYRLTEENHIFIITAYLTSNISKYE